MKLRSIKLLSLLTSVLFASLQANGNAVLDLKSSSNSTVPVGTWVSVYLPTDQTDCSSPQVNGAGSWSISPTPSDTQFSGNYQSVSVKWNYATDYASIRVSYQCTYGGNVETSNAINFIIQNITPSVSLTISPQNICQGGTVSLKASGQQYAGPSPSYTFNEGTFQIYQGGNTQTSYQTPADISPGTHTVTLYMLSSETGTWASTTGTFVVTQRANYKVQFPDIGVLCADNPTVASNVNVSALVTTLNGDIGKLTYTWYSDSGTASTSENYYSYPTLADGKDVYCSVSSDAFCVNSPVPSNHQTIDVTATTTPTVKIVPDITDVCIGGIINFTASQKGTNYKWTLNSTVIANSSTATSVDVTTAQQDPYNNYYFTPTSTLYLEVTGVSGGPCLSTTTATASVSGSQINFRQLPNATISPVGSITICSTCTQTISANVDPTYSYKWMKGTAFIPGETQSTFTTKLQGEYKDGTYKVFTFLNGCPKSSLPLTVAVNTIPTINAGVDQSVSLPLASVPLPASASDLEGPLSYLWTQVSGTSLLLENTTTSTLTVKNLSVGVYAFRLTVTDNNNESNWDEVTLKVYPPNNFNLVKEENILVPGVTSDAGISALTVTSKEQSNSYFDGLGRTIETVSRQSSPLQYDVVQASAYDDYGRENKKYLPYISVENNGAYKANAITSAGQYSNSAQSLYYANGVNDKVIDDAAPYIETIFEASPLNRVLKQGAAGSAWQPVGTNPFSTTDYTVKKRQESNAANDVLQFSYDLSTGAVYFSTGTTPKYFTAGELYANRTFDEQNNEVIEYTDKQGRMICRKIHFKTETDNTKKYTSTYYIYDERGNLAVVMPPEAVSIITGGQ